MIYSDSRYATGNIYLTETAASKIQHATVLRNFPKGKSSFSLYQWKEGDRIDLLANTFYNDPSLWWKIMDFNPQLLNPMDIPVGAVLKVPSVI